MCCRGIDHRLTCVSPSEQLKDKDEPLDVGQLES